MQDAEQYSALHVLRRYSYEDFKNQFFDSIDFNQYFIISFFQIINSFFISCKNKLIGKILIHALIVNKIYQKNFEGNYLYLHVPMRKS